MDHNEFDRKCRKMAELKEKKRELEAKSTEIGNEIQDLTLELHEAYTELNKAGPVGIKDLGKKLVFKMAYRAKVTDNDSFLIWLDKEGVGDIAKRKVDWRTLDRFCNERMENGDEMPEGVEGFMQPQISLNKL